MNRDNFNCHTTKKSYFSNPGFDSPCCCTKNLMKNTLQFLIDSSIPIFPINLSDLYFNFIVDISYNEIYFNSFSDIKIEGDLVYVNGYYNYNPGHSIDCIIPVCNIMGVLFRVASENYYLLNRLLSKYAIPNTTCTSSCCCNDAKYSILSVGESYDWFTFDYFWDIREGGTVIYSNCDIVWIREQDNTYDPTYFDIRISPMCLIGLVGNT